MRVVCFDLKQLETVRKLGVSMKDLTPTGLGDTTLHLVVLSNEQLEALQALGVKPEDVTPAALRSATPATGYLYCRGGKIPNGQVLRTTHKGKTSEALVQGGLIMLNGRGYDSPSAAARGAGHGVVDGWRVWEFLDAKDGKWRPLKVLRARAV
jgi:hypothetical protein